MNEQSIRFIQRNSIEVEKWDRCIRESANGLIYATTLFLDKISNHWDGLVLNDYEAVFPLTWNRKFGFSYLYQPHFTSHLGLFGKKVDESLLLKFLQAIPSQFKYWDFDLNESNPLTAHNSIQGLHLRTRLNYHLSLNPSRDAISAGFSRLATRKIRSANEKFKIEKNLPAEDIIQFYRNLYALKQPEIRAEDYDRIIAICSSPEMKEQITVYGTRGTSDELEAAYIILQDEKYVYSILGGSSEAGKTSGAFYLLTSEAILDHATTPRIFRFEGSDHEGIAFFNSQFGPSEVTYTHIRRNTLPWPIRWLKK